MFLAYAHILQIILKMKYVARNIYHFDKYDVSQLCTSQPTYVYVS
jgi:hypothetical protein